MRRVHPHEGNTLKFDTIHGNVLVYDIVYDDGLPVTVMDTDGAYQSATYHDEKCYDLVFDYHRAYDHIFDGGREPRTFLMLGGGGFAYPKHIIATLPDAQVDVVEIDPMITMIARRFFYLERLFAEFDLYDNERLRIHEQDARTYLEGCTERFDVIVNDCFIGRRPVMSLATLRAAELVHDALNPGGVYASNVIASIAGESSGFLAGVVATLSRVFERVVVIPANKRLPEERGNSIVIATDSLEPFDGAVSISIPAGTEAFEDLSTDTYDSLFFIEDE